MFEQQFMQTTGRN